MKKILILPRWVKSHKLYYNEEIVCKVGNVDEEAKRADPVAGLSLGALILLRSHIQVVGKIVLINPPLPKRNLLTWFIQWLKFSLQEGLFSAHRVTYVINPLKFLSAVAECIRLLSVDFSKILDEIPKGKIVVIRGTKDYFFCDSQAVEFLKRKNIKIIEVDGGHNLSEAMEKALINYK